MRGHATCAIRLPPAVGHKAFAAHMLKLMDCGIQGKITMPIVWGMVEKGWGNKGWRQGWQWGLTVSLRPWSNLMLSSSLGLMSPIEHCKIAKRLSTPWKDLRSLARLQSARLAKCEEHTWQIVKSTLGKIAKSPPRGRLVWDDDWCALTREDSLSDNASACNFPGDKASDALLQDSMGVADRASFSFLINRASHWQPMPACHWQADDHHGFT